MSTSTTSRTNRDESRVVPDTLLFANGSLMQAKPKVRRFEREQDDGTTTKVALYESVPVFRSGTFADSKGVRRTWTAEDMDQMVENFDFLRNHNYLEPPVRTGHINPLQNPMKDVIGYFSNIRAEDRVNPIDGQTYRYVLADYEVLDEQADDRIRRGIYRHRSAEIGLFRLNGEDDKVLYPVMAGVAYVDIPAVQGLDGFAAEHQTDNYSIQLEAPVSGTTDTQNKPEPPKPALPNTNLTVFRIGDKETTDFAQVQAYIADVESKIASFAAQVGTLTSERDALRTANQAFAAKARETQLESLGKSINGEPPVMTAPQVAAAKKFAASLTDEQFGHYMEQFEAAAPNPILSTYGNQVTDDNKPPAAEDEEAKAKADEIANHTAVLQQLKTFSVMSDDKIRETESFKALKRLGAPFEL